MISEEKANLAAKIPRHIRMEMIQRGYNPMDSEDVRRFHNNEQPTGLMKELISYNLSEGANINKMGEGGMNIGADMMAIKQAMTEGDHNIDPEHFKNVPGGDEIFKAMEVDWNDNSPVQQQDKFTQAKDIKKQLGDKITYQPKDVNHKLKNVLGERQAPQQNVPIKTPRKIEERNYITEAVQASKIGYTKGCSYLNAFIRQLKNPTSEGRANLIEAMNKMVLTEEEIHPNILHEYRKGIVKAEKELYLKIKNLQTPIKK